MDSHVYHKQFFDCCKTQKFMNIIKFRTYEKTIKPQTFIAAGVCCLVFSHLIGFFSCYTIIFLKNFCYSQFSEFHSDCTHSGVICPRWEWATLEKKSVPICTSHLKSPPPPIRAWPGHSHFIQVKASEVSFPREQPLVVLSTTPTVPQIHGTPFVKKTH